MFNNTSIHIDVDTLYIINVVCATIGIIPVLFALKQRYFFLFTIFFTCCCISVLYSSIVIDVEINEAIRVFSVLNAISGVILALTVSLSVGLYKSIFGLLRILWLVAIVTASSSYAFFQDEFGSFMPNDVTFITLIASAFLTFVAYVASRFKCCRSSSSNVLPEVFLVVGAFALRFDSDVEKLLNVSFGIAFWNICCWFSATTLIINLKKENEERVEAHSKVGTPADVSTPETSGF